LANHKIKIEVDQTVPKLVYRHLRNNADQGLKVSIPVISRDKIKWSSSEGPFAVLFKQGKAPSQSVALAAAKNHSTSEEDVKSLGGIGRTEADPFAVALYWESGNRLLTDDPDIIITDAGGGDTKPAKPKAKAKAKKPARKKR